MVIYSDLILIEMDVKPELEKLIIYCDCKGERMPPEVKKAVEHLLESSGSNVTILSDLCGITALSREKIQHISSEGKEIMVIGCYKRTMVLLFNQVRNNMLPENAEFLNLIEEDSESAFNKIENFFGRTKRTSVVEKINADTDWPSWYPVIDYSRCTACGQCADFCLFSVYNKSWDRVDVVNPQGCKNNCPACARICPQTALIFPKYKHGGAIGGSEEIDEMAEAARQTQDVEEILGGDIYVALERRKLKRRSIIMEEAMKKAMEEKEKAIRENK